MFNGIQKVAVVGANAAPAAAALAEDSIPSGCSLAIIDGP
jgi:hypothetical protein